MFKFWGMEFSLNGEIFTAEKLLMSFLIYWGMFWRTVLVSILLSVPFFIIYFYVLSNISPFLLAFGVAFILPIFFILAIYLESFFVHYMGYSKSAYETMIIEHHPIEGNSEKPKFSSWRFIKPQLVVFIFSIISSIILGPFSGVISFLGFHVLIQSKLLGFSVTKKQ